MGQDILNNWLSYVRITQSTDVRKVLNIQLECSTKGLAIPQDNLEWLYLTRAPHDKHSNSDDMSFDFSEIDELYSQMYQKIGKRRVLQ